MIRAGALALALVALAAACGDDATTAPADLAAPACNVKEPYCPVCGAGEICFGMGVVHEAACLRPCSSDGDCAPYGTTCYLVTAEKGPVCSYGPPALCPDSSTHCDPASGQPRSFCNATNVIAKPLAGAASQGGCVYELSACANGCDAPDGGAAFCR